MNSKPITGSRVWSDAEKGRLRSLMESGASWAEAAARLGRGRKECRRVGWRMGVRSVWWLERAAGVVRKRRDELRALHGEGLCLVDVARRMRLDTHTVLRVHDELGLEPNPPPAPPPADEEALAEAVETVLVGRLDGALGAIEAEAAGALVAAGLSAERARAVAIRLVQATQVALFPRAFGEPGGGLVGSNGPPGCGAKRLEAYRRLLLAVAERG